MATYIMLTKLTEHGRKTVKKKPNRTNEVNKEVEAMGGKVVAQYAVLGPYDYVNVVEAPDNRTIARISMELGARGTVEIMTLPAVTL
ncbi:MAG: GYD domain-containing protein [Candidatus Rokubacteria bacterium]|nr:GYD domain-containing protein [Candidatus Rokubacteria bacterium]